MNDKVKMVSRKPFGFRTDKITQLYVLQNLGNLP